MGNRKDEHIYDSGNSSNAIVAPSIPIDQAKILIAFFANKVVEKEFENTAKIYTVVSGDRLEKIAKANNTTVEKIKSDNSLTSDNIKIGQKLTINTKKEKGERISFEDTSTGRIGQEIYIIVKTEHFRDKEILIDVKQGKEKVIAEKDKLIEVLQEGKVNLSNPTKVGEWGANQNITNKDDFKDWAVAKINLRPKTGESLKKWEEAVDKTVEKKTYLYLLVDAHSRNPEYEPEKNLIYHGRNIDEDGNTLKTTQNQWLDMEPNWFKLRYCDCGKKDYDKQFKCTRYGTVYGPLYLGTKKLADYTDWDELIKKKKVTKEQKEIMVGMSENEGNLDSVQSYDSEILTVGAMQKTVNPQGGGEFPTQVKEFKKSNLSKYIELFEDCGWTVEDGKMYYKDPYDLKATKITGSALKKKVRDGFKKSQSGKKIKCKPLEPIVKAASDKDFQAKQIADFIKRLNKVLKIKPVGYTYQLKDYLKSKLGKATALDHHINRPAYVDTDFGKALNNFFSKKDKEVEAFNKGKKKEDQKEKVSRNPSEWGAEHSTYEKTILDDYGKNRRGTDMKKRYNNMVSKF